MPKISLTRKPYEITFSRNPIIFRFKVMPYGVEELELNTVVICALWAESLHYKGDFRLIKQTELRPDKDGYCEADWSRHLDGLLKFHTPILSKQLIPNIEPCRGQAVRYFVRYYLANQYNKSGAAVDSAYLHVMKGGLAYEQTHIQQFFENKVIADKQPLHFAYEFEERCQDDPLWLTWVMPNVWNTILKVVMVARLSNGSTVQKTVSIGQFGEKWQIYMCPIGIVHQGLNVGLPVDVYVTRLEATVYYDSLPGWVATAAYEINARTYYETRTLLYHNSLGGLETQTLLGKIDTSPEYEKDKAVLLDSRAFKQRGVLQARDTNDNATERNAFKGETGWIHKQGIENLRDLLNSIQAWEWIGGKMKPINVVSNNSALWSNKDQLYSMAIDWQDAFKDQNFTPDLYLPSPDTYPLVPYFEVSQQRPGVPHIDWEHEEGYDYMEVYISAFNVAPPSQPFSRFVRGQRGSVDITPVTGLGNLTARTYYIWYRNVCDSVAGVVILAGAWQSYGSFTVYKYIPPIVRNLYSDTAKGQNARFLVFDGTGGVLSTTESRNAGGGNVSTYTVQCSGIGSGGGTFNLIGTNVSYTPVNANFTGIDKILFNVYEIVNGYNTGIVTAELRVRVVSVAGANSYATDKPYLQLVILPEGEYHSFNQVNEDIQVMSIRVRAFQDPFGKVPMVVTGLNFNLRQDEEIFPGTTNSNTFISYTMNGAECDCGVYPSKSMVGTGPTNKRYYKYYIAPLGGYYVI